MDSEAIARAAKRAFEASQLVPTSERINALRFIHQELVRAQEAIFIANAEDLKVAKAEVDAGRLSASLINRLDLSRGDKWESMLKGIDDVASLPDPIGIVDLATELDDGLELYRVSCPIGVLLIIFEARPEVVVNIAVLAIKSGNAAILKGGKESNRTTSLLSNAIQAGLSQTQIPSSYIQSIQSRAEVASLLELDQYIDLVIPRGSNSLVRSIQNSTRIPVMGHADGLCSVYLDATANEQKSVRIVLDSKTNYPSACNAAENLIIHESLLHTVWPAVAKSLLSSFVHLICDEASLGALKALSPQPENLTTHVQSSTPDSYRTEHLSLTLSVVTVSSLAAAIQFINSHSSHHTDTIVTENKNAGLVFCRAVDSASTYVNASTRFADGYRYGFGTEVGISTGRIHARGPVGLEGLTIYKYIMSSNDDQGHVVGEFGAGKKAYKHLRIASEKVETFHSELYHKK